MSVPQTSQAITPLPLMLHGNIRLPFDPSARVLRRFSVAEYKQLISIGFFAGGDRYELLDGYLVRKMSRNPPHENGIRALIAALFQCVPAGWMIDTQLALELSESMPEPDFAILRGHWRQFAGSYPKATDVEIVIESSDSSLANDRTAKLALYAREGIREYWIFNVTARQMEVHSQPTGTTYASRIDYRDGDSVPLNLGGVEIARLAMADLLP